MDDNGRGDGSVNPVILGFPMRRTGEGAKLGAEHEQLIETVRSVGYRIRSDE